MGDAAEMALDGTVCQVCGEWLRGSSCGYPVTCLACGGDEIDDDDDDALWDDDTSDDYVEFAVMQLETTSCLLKSEYGVDISEQIGEAIAIIKKTFPDELEDDNATS